MQHKTGNTTIPPELAGRYTDFRMLGSGGSGEVFRAHDTILNKAVAIKLLRQASLNPETAVRFQQEAKVASKLKHHNIVTLMDFGITSKGAPYLAMECAEGMNLAEILDDYGKLPLEAAINILLQVCEGMEHAHNIGIVHRDLKPSNIIVNGDNLVTASVKVLDFGIAKLETADRTAGSVTKPGFIVGTPHYMSPEQFSGVNIDRRSDIYSVGCIMFRIVTGQFPFEGESMLEIMNDKQYCAPRLSDFVESIPDEFDTIVARCLELRPEDRYESMAELMEDLEIGRDHLKELSTYQETVEAPTKRKKRERTLRLSLAACYGILFTCVVPLFFTVLVNSKHVEQPEKADDVLSQIGMSERIAKQFHVDKLNRWTALGMIRDSELEYLATHKADKINVLILGDENTMSSQMRITERGYEALSKLPLRLLIACRSNLDDNALKHISKIATLRHLDITSTKVTDNGLKYLENNTNLIELLLNGDRITGDGIRSISTIKGLRTLYLDDTDISDKDLQPLANLPHLQTLHLNACKITDSGIDFISQMRNVHRLDFGKTTVTAKGFQKLKHLKLTGILVESLKTFDDQCLSIIAKQWPGLTYLNVNDTKITSKGVQSIGKLTQLRNLGLNTLPITDAEMEPIFHLTKLTKLNISLNRNLTDKTMARLAEMPSLVDVQLNCCSGVTERGYSMLAKNKDIQVEQYERNQNAVLEYGSLLNFDN